MSGLVNNVIRGIGEVIFPNICMICGFSLSRSEKVVCMNCLSNEFEKCSIQSDKEEKLLIPESVTFHYSMWKFDKGGYLQMLLHKLKYDRITGVGIDAGRLLGSELLKHPEILNLKSKVLLVPVPLHPAKYKSRGYNQAYLIAKGVSEVTGWEITARYDLHRKKNTRTQTGFDLDQRIKNIEGAFEIRKPEVFTGHQCIIIDDVFTTGTTTFELSTCIYRDTGLRSGIATIAKA